MDWLKLHLFTNFKAILNIAKQKDPDAWVEKITNMI